MGIQLAAFSVIHFRIRSAICKLFRSSMSMWLFAAQPNAAFFNGVGHGRDLVGVNRIDKELAGKRVASADKTRCVFYCCALYSPNKHPTSPLSLDRLESWVC